MHYTPYLRLMIPSDRIYSVSVREPKTVEQKVLKLMEEAGEVAEALLSLTGASGSKDKRKTTKDLLMELVDVVIVAVSCMEALGGEAVEINGLFDEKIKRWEERIGK